MSRKHCGIPCWIPLFNTNSKLFRQKGKKHSRDLGTLNTVNIYHIMYFEYIREFYQWTWILKRMIYSKTNEVQSRMRCSHISLYAYILSRFFAYPAIISCPYLKIVNLVWIKIVVSNDCESTNLFRVSNKPCIYTPQYLSKVIECYPFNN